MLDVFIEERFLTAFLSIVPMEQLFTMHLITNVICHLYSFDFEVSFQKFSHFLENITLRNTFFTKSWNFLYLFAEGDAVLAVQDRTVDV